VVGHWVEETIFFSGMSNSLVNPLIYGFFHLRKTKRRNLMRCQEEGVSMRLGSEGTFIGTPGHTAANGRGSSLAAHAHHMTSFRNKGRNNGGASQTNTQRIDSRQQRSRHFEEAFL
jgi:hypothetical protein